jgi:molybdenum cofactor sulfurtransferase
MEMTDDIYLDAAGAPPPHPELMHLICAEMTNSTHLGNPHSARDATNPALSRMDEARVLVLDHFSVSKDEYDVIFTSGTTASVQLVAQAFPWSADSRLCYPMNVHTSLLGVREFLSENNVWTFASHLVQRGNDHSSLPEVAAPKDPSGNYNLFMVPGECNFSGSKADLNLVSKLTALGGSDVLKYLGAQPISAERTVSPPDTGRWLWLLDAAKLAATSVVDLSILPKEQRPHFVALSFYKIFGYPTGLGALLVRRDVAPLLKPR